MTEIIECITQLASQNDDIAVMWLYGSRADNRFHEKSDYDLAIAFTNFLTDPLDKRARPEMLALEWQSLLKLDEHTLSIVDINQVPVVLAYEIIQYNNVLFCRDEKRWWREENRIYSRMELDITYEMRLHC